MRGGALIAVVGASLVLADAALARDIEIHVISVSTSYRAHAHPPAGPAGDTATMTDRLVNALPQFGRPKGAVVGSDRATMRFLGGNDARLCGVARFPDGTVRICGRSRAGPGGFFLPVVGGTGAYTGATGSVFVAGGGSRALNVFQLTVKPTA